MKAAFYHTRQTKSNKTIFPKLNTLLAGRNGAHKQLAKSSFQIESRGEYCTHVFNCPMNSWEKRALQVERGPSLWLGRVSAYRGACNKTKAQQWIDGAQVPTLN